MEFNKGREKAHSVFLGGKTVEYRIRPSTRAKNISIRISPESGLEIVIPQGIKNVDTGACLKSREGWIMSRLAYLEQQKEKKEYPGQTLFLGRQYPIVPVIKHGTSPMIKLLEGKFFATVPENSIQTITAALEKWYRVQARNIFEERVQAINSKAGFKINRIFIRGQKTRWGSCSRQGNLNFNWRLAMAPGEVIDYIVVHELSHLKEMNHSSNFWDLVESLCPNYREHRKWLRENGWRLTF